MVLPNFLLCQPTTLFAKTKNHIKMEDLLFERASQANVFLTNDLNDY